MFTAICTENQKKQTSSLVLAPPTSLGLTLIYHLLKGCLPWGEAGEEEESQESRHTGWDGLREACLPPDGSNPGPD